MRNIREGKCMKGGTNQFSLVADRPSISPMGQNTHITKDQVRLGLENGLLFELVNWIVDRGWGDQNPEVIIPLVIETCQSTLDFIKEIDDYKDERG